MAERRGAPQKVWYREYGRRGDECAQVGCKARLSRYNPYNTCGPCRAKLLSGQLEAKLFAAEHSEDLHGAGEWDPFPRRPAFEVELPEYGVGDL